MSTYEFKAPSQPDKHTYDEGEGPSAAEPAADRIGDFTPEIGAQVDAADAQPSHEDLMSRQKHQQLTEEEKRQGLEEVSRARRLLGFDK